MGIGHRPDRELSVTDDITGQAPHQAGNTWICADLGTSDYEEVRRLQVALVAARKSGLITEDVLLLVEHPPVLTLGRRGGLEHLAVSEAFLGKLGIPIVAVERGGNITFHGPGQLVGYPIIDLHAAELTATGYVYRLEEVMIRTAAHWGVHAGRDPVNRGVWVGKRKLGSIGIAVRRGIAFHGFALNVNLSLEPFGWINPCGLHGITMTSLERELSTEMTMEEVREEVKSNIETVFRMELTPTDSGFLKRLLNESV